MIPLSSFALPPGKAWPLPWRITAWDVSRGVWILEWHATRDRVVEQSASLSERGFESVTVEHVDGRKVM